MAEDASKGAEETPAKDAKRSRKLPLIASGVVLLAGLASAAWYLGMLPGGGEPRHGEATAAVEGHGGAEGHGAPTGHGEGGKGEGSGAVGLGAILPFESFIANLADEGGKRYLKTTFQVEFRGHGLPPELDARLPQVRDLILTLITSKTFDEIRTPEGKQLLREEILERVNQVLERDAARAVYFTEFIVQ